MEIGNKTCSHRRGGNHYMVVQVKNESGALLHALGNTLQ